MGSNVTRRGRIAELRVMPDVRAGPTRLRCINYGDASRFGGALTV